jgi:hypothetical protein
MRNPAFVIKAREDKVNHYLNALVVTVSRPAPSVLKLNLSWD